MTNVSRIRSNPLGLTFRKASRLDTVTFELEVFSGEVVDAQGLRLNEGVKGTYSVLEGVSS